MVRLAGIFALVLSLGWGVAGCSYDLVRHGGDDGFGEVKTIAITTPSNESFDAGVEYVVADALRRELLRRGAAQVVSDPEAADLVLTGSVGRINTVGRSFSTIVLALEYELTLTLRLSAVRADGSPVPIDGAALSETEIYGASADVEATRKNRQEAIRHLSRVIAGRVADSLSQSLAQ